MGPSWAAEAVGTQTQQKSGGPKCNGTRRVGGPEFRVFFFFHRPLSIFIFFSLSGDLLVSFLPLWGFLVEFWWCFGWSGPPMCLFWPSNCRVQSWPKSASPKQALAKAGRGQSRSWPGFSTDDDPISASKSKTNNRKAKQCKLKKKKQQQEKHKQPTAQVATNCTNNNTNRNNNNTTTQTTE